MIYFFSNSVWKGYSQTSYIKDNNNEEVTNVEENIQHDLTRLIKHE